MSLWGYPQLALNAYLLFYYFNIINSQECLGTIFNDSYLSFSNIIKYNNSIYSKNTIKSIRLRANMRIGPHNKNILSILFGGLLGDAYAERRIKGNGTRISFYQEGSHISYLLWLHNLIAELGYCNSKIPKIKTRLGQKGIVRKVIRFKTWTYTSFNWIHELWYKNNIKIVPSIISEYLTPLALAI